MSSTAASTDVDRPSAGPMSEITYREAMRSRDPRGARRPTSA